MMRGQLHHSQMRQSSSATCRRQAVNRACLDVLESRRLLSFVPVVNYTTGTHPQEVVPADFNNDGKLDFATVNAGSNNVTVLLGNGSGGFGAASHFATGARPGCMAVGDFNNDGKRDGWTSATAAVDWLDRRMRTVIAECLLAVGIYIRRIVCHEGPDGDEIPTWQTIRQSMRFFVPAFDSATRDEKIQIPMAPFPSFLPLFAA
jgi:hypothetical protein